MILGKYTIYDAALEGYNQDWTMHKDAIAIRELEICVIQTLKLLRVQKITHFGK